MELTSLCCSNRQQVLKSPTVTELEIISDAIKIGLPSLLTGLTAVFLFFWATRSHEREKERQRRRQNALEKVATTSKRVFQPVGSRDEVFSLPRIADRSCRSPRDITDSLKPAARSQRLRISMSSRVGSTLGNSPNATLSFPSSLANDCLEVDVDAAPQADGNRSMVAPGLVKCPPSEGRLYVRWLRFQLSLSTCSPILSREAF